ncbi:MAG TPA: hypothetical protein VKT33_01040 [Candidatus Angelobacter sp.]|nr:hypothetical protein [Candidatus Angelobacter sp.]
MLTFLKNTLALLVCLASAQQPAVVEMTSEPSHHFVLQNDFVRVFHVLAPAKSSTLVHQHHHDYVYVTIGDTDLINFRVGEPPAVVKLKDGEVRYTKGGFAHSVTNESEHPFHNVTIELMQSASGVHACTESCSAPVPCADDTRGACPSAQIVLESDQWRAVSVIMPPGAVWKKQGNALPHLIVAVTDLNLTQQDDGKPTTEFHRLAGESVWEGPSGHSLTNSGAQTARLFTLEFKIAPVSARERKNP